MINFLKYINIKDLYFKYSDRIVEKIDVYNKLEQHKKKEKENVDVYEKNKDNN